MKIEFANIVKKYKDRLVLNDLSFLAEDKKFIALVGNNGCGKTTTINVLCNIIGYDSGKVVIDGHHIKTNDNSYKSKTGIVLSRPYYIENFSAKEYLSFVGRFQKVRKKEIDQRIDDISSLLEIEDTQKPIRKLSSGNQMKVSMAAALIHNPELLILDEPFVNLDIATTQKLLQLLDSFRGKKTLFITSHDLDSVVRLCDEFLIMDNGKVILRVDKSDFSSLELLREAVRDRLVKNHDHQSFSWFN